MRETTLHVVLRIPRRHRIDGETYDPIREHNRIVRKYNNVVVAKFGSHRLANSSTIEVREQIAKGRRCCLFLVIKDRGQFFGFRAPLVEVSVGPLGSDTAGIRYPTYYARVEAGTAMYFVVSDEFLPADIEGLLLASNERKLLDVLSECRTPLMLVHRPEAEMEE